MRHRLSLLLAITPLLLALACQKENESEIHDTAVIRTVLQTQPALGSTKAVTIFATCDWSLEGDGWFTIEPSRGGQGISESVISISPNNTGEERTGTMAKSVVSGISFPISVLKQFTMAFPSGCSEFFSTSATIV